MPKFSASWEKSLSPMGNIRRLGGLKWNSVLVRPQIGRAINEVAKLAAKLTQAKSRVKSREETMFSRIVFALQKGDHEHASILANELSEIRKLGAKVDGASLALEQVAIRLRTITDMGDVIADMAPAIAVVKSVGQELSSFLPGAQVEIGEISSLLSGTLVEAGTLGGGSLSFKAANEEAEKVLEEASSIARERMEENLPKISVGLGQDEEGLTW